MAGIITLSPGHDASYPFKQIGKQAGAGYYSAAADRGGEPDGIWTGDGCSSLGLAPGATIDERTFVTLYDQLVDPRSGERLGRKMQDFARSAQDIEDSLLELEPEATAERVAELRALAKSQVREAVKYFDGTFSVSKSITLLHASALASSAQSAAAGDLEAAAYWQKAADDAWGAIMEGNQAGLSYLQEHAGYTRSGYHGHERAGMREDAHAFVIGSFRQHTSRNGDPQLHVHNLMLNRVQRERDGAWRTIDGQALYREAKAAAAQAAFVTENAIAREFGVQWIPRADGNGREIAGVSQEIMDLFSSRTREDIGPKLARMADEYREKYGRDPDAHALGSMSNQAAALTRLSKEDTPLDIPAQVRLWSAQAREAEGQALEPLIAQVSNRQGPGQARAPVSPVAPAAPLSLSQERDLMAMALATVQSARSTWTRSALMRALGKLLPGNTGVMSREDAGGYLSRLTDRVLAGEAGAVVMLEAPEWPPVPDALRRGNGESMFTAHQAERYATQAQLTMEESVSAMAAERGAHIPRLSPELAAELLGSGMAQLEAQLDRDVPADVTTGTGSGLHLDQAAAAYWLMTSDRRAEVMTGPAGTGKTRTVAAMSRAWLLAHPGSRVIGLTTSQRARHVLADAGVHDAFNIEKFLQSPSVSSRIPRNSLIIMDEASMISMRHYYQVLRIAAAAGARVAVTGDAQQLGAVESGGGMDMIARSLGGRAQLGEPMRFRGGWERAASLRLRAGEAAVLAEYDQQGRLFYGTREEMLELAYRRWLADYLDGRDSVLMARTEEDAAEMARRARGDLLHFGLVAAGGEVALRAGARASAGDRIMARRNRHRKDVGVPGRGLANRDVLEVLDTSQAQVRVRLLTGRDAEGVEQWGRPFDLSRKYLRQETHLAYGITVAAAQGSTYEDHGHGLVTAADDRKSLYPEMTRGRAGNFAYVVVARAVSDADEPTPAAPEVARSRALARERAGELPGELTAELDGDAVSVLTGVIGRDDSDLAASHVLEQAYSDADHLGVIGSRWLALMQQVSADRYRTLVREALPAYLADDAGRDHAAKWLYRSLREAELAGLDAETVIRDAVRMREMTGARDVARVLDGRIRQMLRGVQPQVGGSYASRVPEGLPGDVTAYLRRLAEMIDARIARLGEHAAATAPTWATRALGPVPEDPAARADWQERAAAVAAYREWYGYDNTADPIGPAPGKTSPEARVAWQGALAALGTVDGMDLRHLTDGDLLARRAMYERETAWAPPHVGDELRLSRMTVAEARERIIRAGHELRAANGPDARTAHEENRAIWEAMRVKAEEQMTAYEKADAARREWDRDTERSRRTALAADLLLQRRHPREQREPLRSAEPVTELQRVRATAQAEPAQEVQPDLDGTIAPRAEPEAPTVREQDQRMRAALGLTAGAAREPSPEHVERVRETARATEEVLAGLRSMQEPDEDPDMSPSEAWAVVTGRQRESVMQQESPLVPPAPELTAEPQMEAGE